MPPIGIQQHDRRDVENGPVPARGEEVRRDDTIRRTERVDLQHADQLLSEEGNDGRSGAQIDHPVSCCVARRV